MKFGRRLLLFVGRMARFARGAELVQRRLRLALVLGLGGVIQRLGVFEVGLGELLKSALSPARRIVFFQECAELHEIFGEILHLAPIGRFGLQRGLELGQWGTSSLMELVHDLLDGGGFLGSQPLPRSPWLPGCLPHIPVVSSVISAFEAKRNTARGGGVVSRNSRTEDGCVRRLGCAVFMQYTSRPAGKAVCRAD